MTTAHTPGPWHSVQNYGMGEPIKLTNPTSIAMCGSGGAYVTSLGCPPEEMAANARLIAAAPDLLAALEAILPMFDNDSPLLTVYDAEIKQARAAIDKAKGL